MHHELSDNQRRTICRVLFLALCLLPSCATIYTAFHKPSAKQWAQQIHAELGLQTRIGNVETPLPNKLVLRNLQMFDADGLEVIDVLEARVTLGDENTIQINAPVTLTRRGMDRFMDEVTDRVVRPRDSFKPWRVQFADVEILSGEKNDLRCKTTRLAPLNIYVKNSLHGIEARLETPISNPDPDRADKWISFSLERGSQDQATRFVFNNTADKKAMPCWLLQNRVPQLERLLGPEAGFLGTASGWVLDGQPDFYIDGQFVSADLSLHDRRAAGQKRGVIIADKLRFVGSAWKEGRALLEMTGAAPVEIPNPHSSMYEPYSPEEMLGASIGDAIRQGNSRSARLPPY